MLKFSEIFEFSWENSYFERILMVRIVRMVRMVRSLADRTFQPRSDLRVPMHHPALRVFLACPCCRLHRIGLLGILLLGKRGTQDRRRDESAVPGKGPIQASRPHVRLVAAPRGRGSPGDG